MAPPAPASSFEPTRAQALRKLAAFLPQAGTDYARSRNLDRGPGAASSVSRLSPYLRRRMLSESEVVAAVLKAQGLEAGAKFTEEVLWRTYWKGWLQLRPGVWERYLQELHRQHQRLANDAALAARVAAAESGRTGIDGFDDWARELVRSGYLHNHARMNFASIWIFTLQLPWTLGADFFARHLLDFDPASNTLSWRWVAGLQTPGKIYLAKAETIAACSEGRFHPRGLAQQAQALSEPALPATRQLPAPDPLLEGPALLLVHPEDLNPLGWLPPALELRGAALLGLTDSSSRGQAARAFEVGALEDSRQRLEASGLHAHWLEDAGAEQLVAQADACGANAIVCAEAAVGPLTAQLDQLAAQLSSTGIPLYRLRTPWDAEFWPQARAGFFGFRRHIESGLRRLGLGACS